MNVMYVLGCSMQWFRAWWRDENGLHWAVTRETTTVSAKTKIVKAIGRDVDGVELIQGYRLKHVQSNRRHYLFVA